MLKNKYISNRCYTFFNMIEFISGLDYVVRLRRLSSLKFYR